MYSKKQLLNTIFILLTIIFILLCFFMPGALENWVPYKQKPYDYYKTGSNPLNFYERSRFRKPYRYPFQFKKSYPIKHMSYLD